MTYIYIYTYNALDTDAVTKSFERILRCGFLRELLVVMRVGYHQLLHRSWWWVLPMEGDHLPSYLPQSSRQTQHLPFLTSKIHLEQGFFFLQTSSSNFFLFEKLSQWCSNSKPFKISKTLGFSWLKIPFPSKSFQASLTAPAFERMKRVWPSDSKEYQALNPTGPWVLGGIKVLWQECVTKQNLNITLPETKSSPLKMGRAQNKTRYPTIPFPGAMLVFVEGI